MKSILNYLTHKRDAALLTAAFVLLLVALFKPTMPIKRDIYSYLIVVDISQSMNVEDMRFNGKTVSRIEYSRKMLHELISSMPCGTRVSVAPFAGVSIAPLFTPIEVCANYAAIQDAIEHLEWRMAWSGNSRIRESMLAIDRSVRALPEPAQVVFFTDAEEAPRLHAFNTRDLTGFQSTSDWLLVGIGSEKGAPIPKYDEKNQRIGYWAGDSFAMQPGIAQISEQNIGNRDNNVAGSESDRYISKLDQTYVKALAKEVGASYVMGDSLTAIKIAMSQQKPARRDIAPFSLNWVLAAVAGLLLMIAYIPAHPLYLLKHLLRSGKRSSKAS